MSGLLLAARRGSYLLDSCHEGIIVMSVSCQEGAMSGLLLAARRGSSIG